MVYGSILANTGGFCLTTADGISKEIENNPLTRSALRLFGIPHIGLRLRSGIISNFLDIKKDDIILDAGCGMGLYLLSLAKKIRGGYGVDIDRKKIDRGDKAAKELRLNNLLFKAGDAVSLEFTDGFFDKVICSEVMEHIEDDRKLVRGFFRVIKKGGVLVVTTTSLSRVNREHQEAFQHARAGYNPQELKEIFLESGFTIDKMIPYGLYFGKFSWRINRRLLAHSILNVLSFYPLLMVSALDRLLPYRLGGDCIGYVIKLRK